MEEWKKGKLTEFLAVQTLLIKQMQQSQNQESENRRMSKKYRPSSHGF